MTFPLRLAPPSRSLRRRLASSQRYAWLFVSFRSLRSSLVIYDGPEHQAPISHVVVRLELSLALHQPIKIGAGLSTNNGLTQRSNLHVVEETFVRVTCLAGQL